MEVPQVSSDIAPLVWGENDPGGGEVAVDGILDSEKLWEIATKGMRAVVTEPSTVTVCGSVSVRHNVHKELGGGEIGNPPQNGLKPVPLHSRVSVRGCATDLRGGTEVEEHRNRLSWYPHTTFRHRDRCLKNFGHHRKHLCSENLRPHSSTITVLFTKTKKSELGLCGVQRKIHRAKNDRNCSRHGY